MTERLPLRSWLYVPGNSERLLRHARSVVTDAVVLDLEDSVPASEKQRARSLARAFVSDGVSRARQLWVRVNATHSGEMEFDLDALIVPGLSGIRLPKVEDSADVVQVARLISEREKAAELRAGTIQIVCGIESAAGVLNAAEIAASSERVLALSFGSADFCLDVSATEDEPRLNTLAARSHLVLVSRAAGIAPPIDSAYLVLDDDTGLRRSTMAGKELGFFGRSAIHPRQLGVIHEVLTPTPTEVDRARDIVSSAQEHADQGAFLMPSGEFVDEPIIRRARSVIAMASGFQDPKQ